MTNNLYRQAAEDLLAKYGVSVRRYRPSYAGCAHEDRTIEAPEPIGSISFGILAHEVGHVVLHGSRQNPRFVEEVEAWEFALNALDEYGLKGYERLYTRALQAIAYSFQKALRRKYPPALIENRFPVWWKEASPFLR